MTDDQLNVGVTDTFVLPLVGLDKLGAGSAGTAVVKLRDADQTLPSVALPARTSQKYVVPGCSVPELGV